MNKPKAVILAAGQGTRMKSKQPKVLHEVCGAPMLDYVIDACRAAGVAEIAVVVGFGGEAVAAMLPADVKVYWQHEQLGTGHAVLQAQDFFAEESSEVLILMGDAPMITAATLTELMAAHRDGAFAGTVLTAEVDDPTGFGRMLKEGDLLLGIVEEKDATPEQRTITEVNSGMYCFDSQALTQALGQLNTDNVQGEYYLTDTIGILGGAGQRVGTCVVADNEDLAAANSKAQLAELNALMRRRINTRLMDEGAVLIDPAATYLSPGTTIGIDTVIYPGVVTKGRVTIGEDCVIGTASRLEDVVVGDRVSIWESTVLKSSIDDDTTVGPYAYIRPGSKIGKDVKVGDFVEVKNAVMADGAKASHLTYIGDAEVGRNVNLGCGTVFVNYDGAEKNLTIVEDEVFIGCNTNLIAPVTVKQGSYVAAGSTITDDVPADSLAIARARQVNKVGYGEKMPRKNKK